MPENKQAKRAKWVNQIISFWRKLVRTLRPGGTHLSFAPEDMKGLREEGIVRKEGATTYTQYGTFQTSEAPVNDEWREKLTLKRWTPGDKVVPKVGGEKIKNELDDEEYRRMWRERLTLKRWAPKPKSDPR